MNFTYKLINWLVISSIVLLPATIAKAQGVPSAEEVAAQAAAGTLDLGVKVQNTLPEIYVKDLQVKSDEDNKLEGTFTVINKSNGYVGDISYNLSVINPQTNLLLGEIVPDVQSIYYQENNSDSFNLAANQSKTISFHSQAINLPKNDYRIRIALETKTQRGLGWNDYEIKMGNADGFSIFTTTGISVNSIDPFTKESRNSWEALEGPNVDPGQSITLKATVKNIGAKDLVVTPKFSIKQDLTVKNNVSVITKDKLTIKAGDSQALTWDIVAASNPGVYEVMLGLVDNNDNVVSDLAEYRYVVRGISASLLAQKVTSLPSNAGDSAKVDFAIAGPADRETDLTGTVELSLLDNNEVIGSTSSLIDFTKNDSAEGEATIKLTKSICSPPTLRTVIKDHNGNVLESSDTILEGATTFSCGIWQFLKQQATWLVLVLAIIILIIIAIIIFKRRKTSTPMEGTIASFILLTILSVGALIYAQSVHANGIQWKTGDNWQTGTARVYGISLFVNSPRHNSQIVGGKDIKYNARFTWQTCGNQGSWAAMRVYAAQDSGHASSPNGHSWNLLAKASQGWQRTWQWRGMTISAILPAQKQGETSIWTYANASRRHHIYGEASTVLNDITWLNITPPPECSDGIDNDGDGGIDALVEVGNKVTGGTFRSESALPKYGKTWIASIDCRDAKGKVTRTGSNNPFTLRNTVAKAMVDKKITIAVPKFALVRSDNGIEHKPTLEAVCKILGYKEYVSSTCLDYNRTWRYPHGKCNYHSPHNDRMSRFYGNLKVTAAQCSDGIDNDGDGKIDMDDSGCASVSDNNELQHDLQCDSPDDDNEGDRQCSDGIDNDGDGKIDCKDPGCFPDDDISKTCDPTDSDENEKPVAIIKTQQVFLGDPLKIDGSDSHDPDGEVIDWKWKITDPDNVITTYTDKKITIDTTKVGPYSISLTVTDDGNSTTTKETSVSVVETIIKAVVKTRGNTINESVTLDGSASKPDNDIVKYSWAVKDSDQSFVEVTSSDKDTASFTPAKTGIYTVSLTVTDSRDRTNTKTKALSIGRPLVDPGDITEIE